MLVWGKTPEQIRQVMAEMSDDECAELERDWSLWARPNQLPPPGDWRFWLLLTGRGWGKTRTGAEWTRMKVEGGAAQRFALVGRTAADVRDTMVEGAAGILATASPHCRPAYEPSKRRITWPNGAQATTFSGDEPDQLRGPEHDHAWADELAAWKKPEAWTHLNLGLRIGDHPQCIATTTPRPTALIKGLVANPASRVVRGSTFENRANLAPASLAEYVSAYGGTRLGRQELYGEILEDNPGALWKREWIDRDRVTKAPDLALVFTAVDPTVTATETSNQAGIVTAGVTNEGVFFVLGDDTMRGTPNEWASQAVVAANRFSADALFYETNQGGDLVAGVLHLAQADQAVKLPVHGVHASRGKQTRAAPISMLYEQGRVHHVGSFRELEDELCEWEPGAPSPDRMDALVWAITALLEAIGHGGEVQVVDAIEAYGGVEGWD